MDHPLNCPVRSVTRTNYIDRLSEWISIIQPRARPSGLQMDEVRIEALAGTTHECIIIDEPTGIPHIHTPTYHGSWFLDYRSCYISNLIIGCLCPSPCEIVTVLLSVASLVRLLTSYVFSRISETYRQYSLWYIL